MMWFGHGMGLGWSIFGWLMMIAFWGGLIVLGFFAIRALSNTNPSNRNPLSDQSPLDILKARYARGELSKDEYETMRADLA